MKGKREGLKIAVTVVVIIVAIAWLITGDGSRLEPSIQVLNSVGILVIFAWNGSEDELQ